MEDSLGNVGVVVPCYNEKEKVGDVILKAEKEGKVLVVNDGSTDTSLDVIKNSGVSYLSYPVNVGKGFALRKGVDFLFNKGYDLVVMIDSDGQHNPEEMPKLVSDCPGITCGVRSGSQPQDRKFGNNLINWWLRMVWGIRASDSQCGFRVLKKEVYDKVRWVSNDYFVETEMLIRAKKQNVQVKEVPIQMIYHDKYKGQDLIGGVKICFNILFSRFLT